MKVSTDKSRATVRRVARITEDQPVVKPVGYRRPFRVDTVVIDYEWEDGTFRADDSFSIHMEGHWVKKDGTDALDRAAGMRPDYVSYYSREWQEQYAFLEPIIDRLRPNGDLSMMILTDAEVG